MKEVIEVKRDDLRELYQVLTNYPVISKEQVQNEMHKVFGKIHSNSKTSWSV